MYLEADLFREFLNVANDAKFTTLERINNKIICTNML